MVRTRIDKEILVGQDGKDKIVNVKRFENRILNVNLELKKSGVNYKHMCSTSWFGQKRLRDNYEINYMS